MQEGDEIGPMVKGPLTVTDMICWHSGMGMGLYGVRPLRLGYQNRRRIPRFFHRDPQNVPDVMQRVHWDPEFARRSATPRPSTTGACARRGSSTSAPIGWVTMPGSGSSTANSGGSTTWVTRSGCAARVVQKLVLDGDRPAVELELEAVNQRGEATTPGHATILLPSRAHGAVRLPDPPARRRDLQGALEAISSEFSRR